MNNILELILLKMFLKNTFFTLELKWSQWECFFLVFFFIYLLLWGSAELNSYKNNFAMKHWMKAYFYVHMQSFMRAHVFIPVSVCVTTNVQIILFFFAWEDNLAFKMQVCLCFWCECMNLCECLCHVYGEPESPHL